MEAFRKEEKVRRLSWTNSIPVEEMREMLGVEAPQIEKSCKCEVCDIHCPSEEKLAMHREFSKTHENMMKLATASDEGETNTVDLPIPPPTTTTTTDVSMPPPTPVVTKETTKIPEKDNNPVLHKKDNLTSAERLNTLVDGKSPNRSNVTYVAPPPPRNYRNTKNIEFAKKSPQKLKNLAMETEGQAGEVVEQKTQPKEKDTLEKVEAVELWKTILSTLHTVEEDSLMKPRSLPLLGSEMKLFRFITAQCDIYGDDALVKVVAIVGTSDKEITLLLDRKSIEAKIESNEKLTTVVDEDKDLYERSIKPQKDPVFEFIMSRLQMNSKGELTLIETGNDSLCDTNLKVYKYIGVSSDLFETKKPVLSKKKETVVVDESEIEKLRNAVNENLTNIRRKSIEALNLHEDITKQMTSLSGISSEGS